MLSDPRACPPLTRMFRVRRTEKHMRNLQVSHRTCTSGSTLDIHPVGLHSPEFSLLVEMSASASCPKLATEPRTRNMLHRRSSGPICVYCELLHLGNDCQLRVFALI